MKDDRYCFFYEDKSNISHTPPKSLKRLRVFKTALLIAISIILVSAANLYIGIAIGKNHNKEKMVVVYKEPTDQPDYADNRLQSITQVLSTAASSLVEISGGGSGIVWTNKGHILTSYDNIKGKNDISVIAHGTEEYSAILHAFDKETNLAVIKIEPDSLRPIFISDFSEITDSMDIIPLSFPFLSSNSGAQDVKIIRLEHDTAKLGTYSDLPFYPTNMQLTPDYKGGGVFNTHGGLVGIICHKDASSIDAFIPAEYAASVVKDLLEVGYVRGRVDYNIIRLKECKTPTMVNQKTGLYVESVKLQSNISLRLDDYIISIDNENIATKAEWYNKIKSYKVGDTITIAYERRQQNGNIIEGRCQITLNEQTSPS